MQVLTNNHTCRGVDCLEGGLEVGLGVLAWLVGGAEVSVKGLSRSMS